MQAYLPTLYALPMPARPSEPSKACLARAPRPDWPSATCPRGVRARARIFWPALSCASLFCASPMFWSILPGQCANIADATSQASGSVRLPLSIPGRPRSRGAGNVNAVSPSRVYFYSYLSRSLLLKNQVSRRVAWGPSATCWP